MNWIPTDEIKTRLGLPDEAIREYQRSLTIGTDFKKTGRVFLWSESAYAALEASLGVKASDVSPEKNAAPAGTGEAGGPSVRSWWVLDSWPGGMWLRAAEKGARPRDRRDTVRVRGIPRRGFAVGTELRCTHLHDDLWVFNEVVRPARDRVRPGKADSHASATADSDGAGERHGKAALGLCAGDGSKNPAGTAGVAESAGVAAAGAPHKPRN